MAKNSFVSGGGFRSKKLVGLPEVGNLEIVQAYSSTCVSCGEKFSKQKSLEVHHREYKKGDTVYTVIPLCRACHQGLHDRHKAKAMIDTDMLLADPKWANIRFPYGPRQMRVIAFHMKQVAEQAIKDAGELVEKAARYEQMIEEGRTVSDIHIELFGPSEYQMKQISREAQAKAQAEANERRQKENHDFLAQAIKMKEAINAARDAGVDFDLEVWQKGQVLAEKTDSNITFEQADGRGNRP